MKPPPKAFYPKSVEIMVRSFNDEPKRLYAVAAGQGRIEVTGSDPTRSMRWREEWVYTFEDVVFDELHNAYEQGDSDALKRLWNKADRFKWPEESTQLRSR